MKVIVTGSRKWSDGGRVWRELTKLFVTSGPFHLMHGDCSTGADAMAHQWFQGVGRELGCTEERFAANWEVGPRAGPDRNRRMVRAGADLVLAFPLPEGSGTQNTMNLARQANITVIEFRGE